MVDNIRIEESLSALMDSEAQELETRRVVKEISADSELRETWHRYQLASAAMKRDLPIKMVDLSQAISEAIDEEPVPRAGLRSLVQPLGKMAVAASVALVAVIGVQQYQTGQQTSAASHAQVADTSSEEDSGAAQFQLPAGFDLPPVSARTVSAGVQYETQPRPTLVVSRRQLPELQNEAAIREYLNLMMERHTRNAATSSTSQGLMPLARLPQLNEGN